MRRTAFRRLQTNIPIQWLLRDEFSDTRAAGAVNGTMATPGPGGARNSTSNNVAISSGEIVATGTGTWGQAGWYLSPVLVRTVGLAAIMRIKITSSALFMAGFTSTTDFSFGGYANNGITSATGPVLAARGNAGATSPSLMSISNSTYYWVAQILGATGRAVLIYVDPNWLLFWRDSNSSDASLYVGATVNSNTATEVTDSARAIRLPTFFAPLASDGFGASFGTTDGLGHPETSGAGSGGGNVTWTGSTWSVSGGQAINTPGVGSELLDDTGFDNSGAWGKDASWSISGGKALLSLATGSALIWKSGVASTGNWYRFDITIDSISGSGQIRLGAGGAYARLLTGAGSYIQTVRASNSNDQAQIQALNATTLAAQLDNSSFKQLTLAHLFSSCLLSTADVFAGVDLVITAGTQAGIVLNLDSTSSPANFVIAYHDGTNAKLEKCVAGTYTSVISAAATYSSGARLVVSKIGTAYRLYYNNALVGSGTISDSGIVSNTRHGLFSTYASNTMDNFTAYASGSGGEYNLLNRYVNL